MAKGKDCPGFETLGEDIKAARQALGLSRKALAEKVNIDPRYLANIENLSLIHILSPKRDISLTITRLILPALISASILWKPGRLKFVPEYPSSSS